MRKTVLSQQACPVARSLDVIGEWWTLVLVRDAFRGARRFEDFRASGIADNILSTRLKKLVEQGVFERRLYQEHPDRYEYVLTEKGTDLLLVVGALGTWGLKWTKGPGPEVRTITHKECGHPVTLQAYCPDCGRAIAPAEIQAPMMRPLVRAAG